MGHWRLLFQFAFADRLGYQYSLQTDDDSLVISDVGYDIVANAREKNLIMMARSIMTDSPAVSAASLRYQNYLIAPCLFLNIHQCGQTYRVGNDM